MNEKHVTSIVVVVALEIVFAVQCTVQYGAIEIGFWRVGSSFLKPGVKSSQVGSSFLKNRKNRFAKRAEEENRHSGGVQKHRGRCSSKLAPVKHAQVDWVLLGAGVKSGCVSVEISKKIAPAAQL